MRLIARSAYALASLAVVAGVIAIPGAASAAGPITFSISSVQGSPALLAFKATASTAINADSITAHMISADQSDVLDVNGFQLNAGDDPANGTWTAPNPFTEGTGAGQLPAGNYAVRVDATDTGGDNVTLAQADGTFNFLEQPHITLSASSSVVDFDHQSVTFSGTATETPTGGTASAPLQSQPITLQNTRGWSGTATTDANGAFSFKLQQPELDELYTASMDATATVAAGTSANAITITGAKDPVQLTAKISAKQVNYGKAVTITGTASYKPGTTVKPLAGTAIHLYGAPPEDSNFKPFKTATTAADGTFTIHFTAKRTTPWTVYAGGLPNSPYLDQLLQQATVKLPQSVALPVQLTQYKASLNPFAVLTVSGCLTITSQAPPQPLPLTVEYAAKRSGPWKTLGTIQGLTGHRCGTGNRGAGFSGQLVVKLSSAYYRVAYPGSPDDQRATTKSILAWKYQTRIESLKVSPRRVHKGGKITVSGRLQVHVTSWRDLARQQVLIILKPKGSKVWYWIYKVKTNSSGKFSKTFVDPVTADWSAEYLGSSQRFASRGPAYRVTVTKPASDSLAHLSRARPVPAWLAHLRAR